ncbi:glycosyltransferase [Nocardioides sp. zg-579]|uniref:Glycosyltransferase n=1 Tax=Nocardioides marmotae TaxID=2663857 RepID=A0A6I3JF12_9ACTN|nr:glycosyltransferase [Nocardioides marmotae]MCR6033172.1 glycosyltransferase [Gordonia jinghuaiqii]MTB96826.1 glycosyltransferase [Nocardioides marmotae]QKE02972.1 glycosyltransferase [Nocardioides marmotae]
MSRPPSGATVPGNRWDLAGPRTGPPPTVTVVVTHYEQPRELARTLHALGRQTHPADRLEVVVADDGSATAPTVPDGVRLVRQADEGFRAAAARNLGAAAGTGEVLVFLDADTTPEPGYVAAISRLPHLLPEALVVGRRRHADLVAVPVDAPVEDAGPAHELSSPAWLVEGYRRTRDLVEADDTSYRFVLSAVAACSRWLHTHIGGFDETFAAYGGEDWEWAARAWRHGALLAHEPAAVAWHDGPDFAARDSAADRARALAETLAIARRVPAPGAAPRGLLVGPRDPLVTIADGLDPTGLLVALDSLLAALPTAHVQAPAYVAGLLAGDPRVAAGPPPGTPAWHLHLERPVRGSAEAWRAVVARLAGPDAPGLLRLTGADGAPLVTARTLRGVRRQERWGRTDLFAERAEPAAGLGLAAVRPGTTLEAHLGGWG